MQGLRSAARMGFVVMALAMALVVPAGVFAADGEIGNMGDPDSITDVTLLDGHAVIDVEYIHDCAGVVGGPIKDCWIEVQFVSRCPEFYCTWAAQPFRRVQGSGLNGGRLHGLG